MHKRSSPDDANTKAALTYFLSRDKSDVSDPEHIGAAIKMLEEQVIKLKRQRKTVLNRQKSKKGFNPKAYPDDLAEKIEEDIQTIMTLPTFSPKRKNSARSDAFRCLARMALQKKCPSMHGPALLREENRVAQILTKIVYRYQQQNPIGNLFLNLPIPKEK